MKAIVQDAYGPADVLKFRDIEKPSPGAADVLLRVRAAGLDMGVWHMMTGIPYLMRPAIGLRAPRSRPGTDVAGVVEEVGAGVTRFRPGDRVFGTCGGGAFAEYACAREDRLAPIPDGLGFEPAAAVPTSAMTALQALRDQARVRAGQRVLVIGAGLGLVMGYIVHAFDIQPFIVTLAGMFLARGLCYTIGTDSIPINDPTFTAFAQARIDLFADMWISPSVIVAVVVVLVAAYVLHYTRLGRAVYATGGSEQSALLMGLPVGRTKIAVYTISGFCSALGGVLLSFYMLSGYGLHAVGMELDAIAAVVIGGTLLTGGSGFLLGTVLGVLVLGLIQTIISFEGTLSSWWTKIFIGMLLFVFILLQRLFSARSRR
ncbi:ABC transporter permease subunit [Nonomuraea angiospora]|uniref:ABC transporter permease subunit n=1 Tax=Nonomuraea angiospora TaxID=46172 RepID=UPI0029A92AC8|nr:alcohol dehydrogenase catalytic domain-containing protein [Nonomuraea angiospora]MDX3104287.1 alcohol dehydrogenase catalytic domain-containing protein [Nonomuraea angiospora]